MRIQIDKVRQEEIDSSILRIINHFTILFKKRKPKRHIFVQIGKELRKQVLTLELTR